MRRLLVLALAVMMVLAMVPTVALAENSEVKAKVDTAFTIYIPPTVNLTKNNDYTSSFDIEATGVLLEAGERIDVTVKSDFSLRAGSATLPFKLLKAGGGIAKSGEVYCSFTKDKVYNGKVTVDPSKIKVAGSYSGVMTFTIDVTRDVVKNDNSVVNIGSIGVIHVQENDSLYVEFYFNSGYVPNDFDLIRLSAYYNDVKIATATFRDYANNGDSNVLGGSFYKDDTKLPEWDLSGPVTNCDSIKLELVKDGITYEYWKTGINF